MGIDPAFNSTPTCNETRAQLYRRAYYASVAYQDYNIGQVLATLDELNATATTQCRTAQKTDVRG